MFRSWDYTEAGKSKAYKRERQEAAAARIQYFNSHENALPFMVRDPITIKQDQRYRQLSRAEKDYFVRLTDELWINKGWLHHDSEFLAEVLELDRQTTDGFIARCLELGLLAKCGFRIYQPELREQYVRAIMKAESRNTASAPSPDVGGWEV
ncbi:MAG: hypothetical protein ED859_03775 [Desulfuromonadales bacterium]|nr:MAG: hypothetical protein ED859_03775 [Desulfuromonadales bacterium]